MNITDNIEKLKSLTSSLIHNALQEIRSKRQESSKSMEEQFRTAEYLLLEAKEYVDGAWEMIESKKCDASLALSRWLLEASINLLWAVDDNKTKQRLKELYGEALRCNANLCEGLAELWPNQALYFKKAAKEAKKTRQNLGIQELKKINVRLKEIKKLNISDLDKIYALYRICCAFAHPSLNVWERFTNIGNATISKKPIDNRSIACWMVATSTLYLVTGTYCLTNLRRKKQLNDWWKQVETLFDNS
jgi:hypothetical protein